ncbi:MAG: SPOR domain-containing protein [Treponema sp.]|jgi:hypothetical protein|nr:SPOR domain-containing protein [Treponema sp.]
MKIRVFICIIAALFTLQGSSPWEGAAAVAPSGELPASGFYVATNSFPRNTIVEITNIESGKSTRAIVANSLNSPGLLATVSQEAANLIGMRAGSVSRIRMVQPNDPMAYVRFSESVTSGASEYDSGAVMDEGRLLAEVYGNDTYVPPLIETPPEPPASMSGFTGRSYIPESEWGGPGGAEIVDVPRYASIDPYTDPEPVDEFWEDTWELVEIPDTEEYLFEEAEELVLETEEEFLEEIEEIAVETEEELFEEGEELAVETEEEFFEEVEELAEETEEQVEETPVELVLVETEEKPPESGLSEYGIDPSDIIPPLEVVVSPQEPQTSVDQKFSVQTISQLVPGQYYVQLASFRAESIESAINQIDKRYDPKILKESRDDLLRIVIGPLNQGESAAVLQRFKSIGYSDAFVRHIR